MNIQPYGADEEGCFPAVAEDAPLPRAE